MFLLRNRHLRRTSYLLQNSSIHSSLPQKQQNEAVTPDQINNIKSINDIPGPKIWPVIGSLLDLKGFGGDLDLTNFYEYTKKLHERYGDIARIKIFDMEQVILYNPEHVKKMFQIDGDSPLRIQIGTLELYFKKKGIPDTLVNSSGERWRKLRSASNPIVAKPQNVHFFLPNQNKIVDDFMRIVNNKFGDNNTIVLNEFQETLRLLAFELISVVAFNKPIKCLDEGNRTSEVTKLAQAVDELLQYAGILMYSPIYRFYPTKMWKKFESASDIVFSTVRKYVNECYNELKTQSEVFKQDMDSKSILQQYLLTMEKYNLSFDDVVALTSDFLSGGIDTTSATIHIVLYELGKNPEVQNILYEEVKANCKDDSYLSEEKLNNMPFLKAVLKESMRLHPIAASNSRLIKEDLILNNYRIPKGTLLMSAAKVISTSDKFYSNSNSFNPKRWIKGNSENNNIHPYGFLPFGFGARMCIGRRLAEQEIYLTLTKFINKFHVEYIGKPMEYKIGLIQSPLHPLNLKITKRK